MDDDELGRLIRAIDPARTPTERPLTGHELAVMHDIMAGRRVGVERVLKPPFHRHRIGWIAASIAVALGGGFGGIAIAGSMMPHGFDDIWVNADYTHSFELPSGRRCEARVMVVDADGGRDLTGRSADASRWLAASDLWETIDWEGARAADAHAAEQNPDQTLLLDENGRLGDALVPSNRRTPDDIEANVVSLAVGAAIDRELDARGIVPGEVYVWDSVRCDVRTD